MGLRRQEARADRGGWRGGAGWQSFAGTIATPCFIENLKMAGWPFAESRWRSACQVGELDCTPQCSEVSSIGRVVSQCRPVKGGGMAELIFELRLIFPRTPAAARYRHG